MKNVKDKVRDETVDISRDSVQRSTWSIPYEHIGRKIALPVLIRTINKPVKEQFNVDAFN